MRQSIHCNYKRLSKKERDFVDRTFTLICYDAKGNGIKLMGDDRMEKAVEALATLIIESKS